MMGKTTLYESGNMVKCLAKHRQWSGCKKEERTCEHILKQQSTEINSINLDENKLVAE
jgi:hypothetical protein